MVSEPSCYLRYSVTERYFDKMFHLVPAPVCCPQDGLRSHGSPCVDPFICCPVAKKARRAQLPFATCPLADGKRAVPAATPQHSPPMSMVEQRWCSTSARTLLKSAPAMQKWPVDQGQQFLFPPLQCLLCSGWSRCWLLLEMFWFKQITFLKEHILSSSLVLCFLWNRT